MITLSLSIEERVNFQFLLPVQGTIATLDTVTSILNKINIKEVPDSDDELNIDFDEKEIALMIDSVKALDQAGKIHLQNLELAKKILRSKML